MRRSRVRTHGDGLTVGHGHRRSGVIKPGELYWRGEDNGEGHHIG